MFISIVFLTAFMMEAIGTYISVYGLGALFAGDIVILTMAVILDVAKIVTVSFLYQNWDDIKSVMKYYLLIAAIILMTITSVGAFGYLSGAFQKAISPSTSSNLQIDSLKRERDSLNSEKDQLNAQRMDINKQIAQLPTNSVKGRRILIASFKPETNRISERLILITHKVDDLNTEVLKVESENVEKNVHVGPILYVAKAFNITVEDASKWIILTIIFVFDPLAIMLILAGNFLVKRKKSGPVIPKPESPVVPIPESPVIPILEETQTTIEVIEEVVDLEEEIILDKMFAELDDLEEELRVDEMFVELEQSHPEAKVAIEAGEQWVKDTFYSGTVSSSSASSFFPSATVIEPIPEPEIPEESMLADCNWTCANASECHDFDCDGESHFIAVEPEPLTKEELELLSLVYDDVDTGEAPSEEIDTEALELAFKDYVPVIPAIDVTGDSTYSGSPQVELIVEEPIKKNRPPPIDLESLQTDLELTTPEALETCSLDTLKINMPEALIRIGVVTPSFKKWFYEN